jgi:hypothetical protein
LNFTSAPNTAIFWSGPQNREKAEKWAGESGRTTLEMTPGGQYLDGLDLFNAKQTYPKAPLAAGMPCEIWDLASSQFAKMATGTAFSFTVGTPAVSPVYCSVRTWFRQAKFLNKFLLTNIQMGNLILVFSSYVLSGSNIIQDAKNSMKNELFMT